MVFSAWAASSTVVRRTVANRWGNRVWSIVQTDQPSASSQIVRMDLPSIFMVDSYPALQDGQSRIQEQHPTAKIARFGSLGCIQRSGTAIWIAEGIMLIDYEAEYNNRARVPDHPDILGRM